MYADYNNVNDWSDGKNFTTEDVTYSIEWAANAAKFKCTKKIS